MSQSQQRIHPLIPLRPLAPARIPPDPSFVITHTVPIEQGPDMYKTFRDKKDGCIKVVLKPWD